MYTKKFAAMAFAMLALFSTKTMADDNVNYEFETFDGKSITINDANICCQRSVENVLESQIVPKDAEVIAPGRDYVYLQDANYYYVEDAKHSLLTIARKDTNTESLLLGNSFLLSYRSSSFTKNADTQSVVLSYTKEGVDAAGSNYARFTLTDEPSCKKYLQQQVRKAGGNVKNISESSMSGVNGKAYIYQTVGESKDSELKTVLALYAVPCGQKTIAIEVFRTLSPDEGTDMTIDADFEHIFQSFITMK